MVMKWWWNGDEMVMKWWWNGDEMVMKYLSVLQSSTYWRILLIVTVSKFPKFTSTTLESLYKY
jgi:hypothetical protein